MRKPYFKKSHKAWYVDLRGKKPARLGTDKDEAFREYHRLMAVDMPVTSRTPVQQLLEQFLGWTKDNRAKSTHRWHLIYCQKFMDFLGPKMLVADLKPYHVSRWLATFNCSDTGKNGACRAIIRGFNWAKRQGLIAVNPISGVERPAAEPRDVYLEGEDWSKAMAALRPTDPLRDLAAFLHATGCRPFEARIAEAHHWDGHETIVLERKNSKGKRAKRVVRLNSEAQGIVRRLAIAHPKGPLFLNRQGKPWTCTALDHAFDKWSAASAVPIFPYALRHTFCTDALLRGVDPLTVATLLGHKDTTMVARVYGHLSQQTDFLREKLKQATGEVRAHKNAPPGIIPVWGFVEWVHGF